MIIEALSNKGRSEICLLSAFTMGSTIMIRCLGIDAAPLLPIITAALNRLQPPLKQAVLFFSSSSSSHCSSFCLTNSPSADRAGELCLGGLFSFSLLPGLVSTTPLQTFRGWNEGKDHGSVRALPLPPLSVFSCICGHKPHYR